MRVKLSKSDIEKKFKLILKDEPYYISDKMIFPGQIPRLNDLGAKKTPFSDELDQPDFVIDDSAVVVIQNKELLVISGCSHSGICNIIEYAPKVTGINFVRTVIGGFHFKHNNLQTRCTINFLKKNGFKKIYPSHCTELPALHEDFNTEQLKTGMILNF